MEEDSCGAHPRWSASDYCSLTYIPFSGLSFPRCHLFFRRTGIGDWSFLRPSPSPADAKVSSSALSWTHSLWASKKGRVQALL
ncbi:hypothetical protein VNO77_46328 [Canavalia gladiata]|uniref:Uncharacterized protein n=1 Tax=Canavalia gladiata TaxID=3824 RepID=A0AAN9JHM3_CANGL